MEWKSESWLWPDHVIGKRESRRLREEHNRLVNQKADLLAALERTLQIAIGYACEARKENEETVSAYPWAKAARAAIDKARAE